MRKSKVKIYYRTELKKKDLNNYDKIIICTYSSNNQILKNLGVLKKLNKNRYELIEKILNKISKKYQKMSYVVVDGKFVCLDPYLGTNYHLLSDVRYSKIEVIKKTLPLFKSNKKKYLDNNIHKNLNISNFKKFITWFKIFAFFKRCKIYWINFVVRTLKKNVEKTMKELVKYSKLIKIYFCIFRKVEYLCLCQTN